MSLRPDSANFRELRHDELFLRALLHTVVFVALSALLLNVLGFSLALLIHSRVAATTSCASRCSCRSASRP